MQAPPPFEHPYQPPAPKKSRVGLWVFLGILGLGVCCILPIIALVGGGFWAFKEVGDTVTCTLTMATAQKAIRNYATEKGHLPNSATWQDDIAPYYDKALSGVKNKENMGPFKLQGAKDVWICSDKAITGIAFNDDLSGAKWDAVKDGNAILLFEVTGATRNAHAKYVKRPKSEGPKVFDKRRPFMELTINGNLNGGAHVDIDTDDDKPSKPSTQDKGDDSDKV